MSTCLSLMHGYIFLLYVYLPNKDVCQEPLGCFTLSQTFAIVEMSQLPQVIVANHPDATFNFGKAHLDFILAANSLAAEVS